MAGTSAAGCLKACIYHGCRLLLCRFLLFNGSTNSLFEMVRTETISMEYTHLPAESELCASEISSSVTAFFPRVFTTLFRWFHTSFNHEVSVRDRSHLSLKSAGEVPLCFSLMWCSSLFRQIADEGHKGHSMGTFDKGDRYCGRTGRSVIEGE